MSDDEFELRQDSDESRAALRRTADQLISAIEIHTARLVELRGGSSGVVDLFALNDQLRRAAAAWDDAAFDHTGTFPLAVELDEDDVDDEEDDEQEEELLSFVSVSVVSRWDLEVTDMPDLIQAGRSAHRRNQPDETDEDARVAIKDSGVGQALYALAHDHGEPWFDVPGLQLAAAHRVYVARRDVLSDHVPAVGADLEDDLDDDLLPLVVPEGRLLFGESW